MRVIRRQEFLALSKPTPYLKMVIDKDGYLDHNSMEPLSIFYPNDDYTKNNAWVYASLDVWGNDWENITRLTKEYLEGLSQPADFSTARDGSFDGDKVVFLILEKDDIKEMINLLSECLDE